MLHSPGQNSNRVGGKYTHHTLMSPPSFESHRRARLNTISYNVSSKCVVKRNVKYNYLSFLGLLSFFGLLRFLGLFVFLGLFLLLALYLTFVFATLFSLTTAFFCWNLSFALFFSLMFFSLLFFGLLSTVLKLFKNISLIACSKYQMWF